MAVSWLHRKKFNYSAWLKIEISVVGNGSTWKNRDTNSRILLSTITMLHDTNTIITLDKICNPQDTEWSVCAGNDSLHTYRSFLAPGFVYIQWINDSSTYWIQDRSDIECFNIYPRLHVHKFLADIVTKSKSVRQQSKYRKQHYSKFLLHLTAYFTRINIV